MATSGSIDFSVSRDDIITEALEQLGVLEDGETPSASQLATAARTLNLMIKAWQGEGLNLFAVQQAYLFLSSTATSYPLSGAISDRFVTSFTETTTSAPANSGTYSLTVTSVTGMSTSYTIGIVQDDNTIHWTTIANEPVGFVIALTSPTTAAISSGNRVFVYTASVLATRPMRVLGVIRRDKDGNDIPLEPYNQDDYIRVPNKYLKSKPNFYYYNPQITTGILYLWPLPDIVTDYLVLWTQRTLSDFDSATNTPDYPQEWFLALALNLAVLLAPKFGIPLQTVVDIRAGAREAKVIAKGFDNEVSIKLVPDPRR